MAEPTLKWFKTQETARCICVGPMNGLLQSLMVTHGSTEIQANIAGQDLVQLVFEERRVGLYCLVNQIQETKQLENVVYNKDNEDWTTKSGRVQTLVRGKIQSWRKTIRKEFAENLIGWRKTLTLSEQVTDG